jgi:hypothetical protein
MYWRQSTCGVVLQSIPNVAKLRLMRIPKTRRQRPVNSSHRAPQLRQAFKARLREKISEKWGSTRGAIAAGVATKSLYHWLNPEEQALPSADDLADICERGGISPEWLLFGTGPESLGATRPKHELANELAISVKTELLRRGLDRILVRSLTPELILMSATDVLAREVEVWSRLEEDLITVHLVFPRTKAEREKLGLSVKQLRQVQLDLIAGAERDAPLLASFVKETGGYA